MTANRRIIINTLATYGRSLFSLFVGVFSARWVLMALGESDLGIFGVVGSIILCIQLLNIVMSTAVARFFAFAIGEAKTMDSVSAQRLLVGWFNAAISVHVILPVLLCVIGYPIGLWLIEKWLVVPPDRIDACVWVFRFSLFSAFIGMVSVPYIAMYRARQLIAELTVWEVLRTIIVFCGAFFLLYFKGDRLIIYAAIMSFSPVLILCIQMYRAHIQFDCCRIRLKALFCYEKIKKILVFGCCDLFSSLGCIVRDQGAAFVINKVYGPAVNSAYGIANQLSNQTNALAGAMNGALLPAITTCEGEGDCSKAIALAHRSCKYCTLLVLVFAIPLYLEADLVLKLWLVNPPMYAPMLCRYVLITAVCFKLGWGYHMAICAKGRVALYHFVVGCISVLTLPVMYVLVQAYGVAGVGWSLIGNAFILSMVRVLFARRLVHISASYWVKRIFIPISMISFLCLLSGSVARGFLDATFFRIVLTSVVVILVLLVLSWLIVLDCDERNFILVNIKKKH